METKKLCAILVSLAGCASYPQPTDNLAQSVGAVHGAKEAGAEKIPDAALHLRLAQEQNEKAQKLMADDENERATYVTERARSDAELALAMAREEKARKRAQQATASLSPGMENEMSPGMGSPEMGSTPTPTPAPAQPATPPPAGQAVPPSTP
jgi:hypothetical protein